MGAGLALPLLISGAATGAGVLNQEAAQRRADRITAAGIRQQGVRQRDINARVDQEIGRVEGSDPAMEQQRANAQYLEQLRRSRAAARGITGVPGASRRYSDDLLAGDAAVDANAARVAELMSRSDAPLRQRERETFGLDRLRSDVGVIGRNAEGDAFLNQLRLRRVRPNPWVNALAGLAQGYASGLATRAPAGTLGARSPANVDDILGVGGASGLPPLQGGTLIDLPVRRPVPGWMGGWLS